MQLIVMRATFSFVWFKRQKLFLVSIKFLFVTNLLFWIYVISYSLSLDILYSPAWLCNILVPTNAVCSVIIPNGYTFPCHVPTWISMPSSISPCGNLLSLNDTMHYMTLVISSCSKSLSLDANMTSVPTWWSADFTVQLRCFVTVWKFVPLGCD